MSDDRLGQVRILKHCNELRGENTHQIHSAPYRMGSRARELEKREIGKRLVQRVIEPAQTE